MGPNFGNTLVHYVRIGWNAGARRADARKRSGRK